VRERFVDWTLLELDLITGRTHQIRVHLESIGHAIAGDALYRTRTDPWRAGWLVPSVPPRRGAQTDLPLGRSSHPGDGAAAAGAGVGPRRAAGGRPLSDAVENEEGIGGVEPAERVDGAPGAMLVIISGPSGVGKDTIIDAVRLRTHEP